jgi:mannose-1-phosphate guanylyltransferase
MKAMILTAGLGTRFRPHTDKLAKPALPFLNIPLMGYSLYHLESLGLTDLVLNLHHLPKTIRVAADCTTYGASGVNGGAGYKTHFSDEPGRILGSGGGIRHAEKLLSGGGHFVVSNGDEVLFFKTQDRFKKFFEAHKASGAIATLLTTDNAAVGVSLNGLRVNAASEITEFSIREKGLAHFTGVFAFADRIFDYMPKSGEFHIFKDVLVAAIKRGEKVLAHHIPDMLWLETGGEKEFIESTESALKHLNEQSEFSVQMKAIFERYKQTPVRARDGLWLGPGAKFEGELNGNSVALIGANSHVKAGTEVRGFAVIGFNAVVDNGVIERSVIAPALHLHEMLALKNQLII